MKRLNLKALVAAGAVVAAGAAQAQTTGIDVSGVLSGLDATSVVSGIVAAGAIFALPGFAKWAVKKVATFFG